MHDPTAGCVIKACLCVTDGVGQVLGVLCMIDEGEADWKVIAIDREDEWSVTSVTRAVARSA